MKPTNKKPVPEVLVYDKVSEIGQFCLAEAIAQTIDGQPIPEGWYDKRQLEVVLIINGVQFSFIKLMEHHWSQHQALLREASRDYAVALLQKEFGDRLERAMAMMQELFPLHDDGKEP